MNSKLSVSCMKLQIEVNVPSHDKYISKIFLCNIFFLFQIVLQHKWNKYVCVYFVVTFMSFSIDAINVAFSSLIDRSLFVVASAQDFISSLLLTLCHCVIQEQAQNNKSVPEVSLKTQGKAFLLSLFYKITGSAVHRCSCSKRVSFL